MNGHSIKLIRKQLRNVAQDMVPETFNKEAKEVLLKAVFDEVSRRLDIIENNVTNSLAQLDARQKDMQSLIARTLMGAQQADATEAPAVGQIETPTLSPIQE